MICLDKVKYYEVEFAGISKKPVDTYTICIKGKKKPTEEEAEIFCKADMISMGYDFVHSVDEITRAEAYRFYDMENEAQFPIFE